MDKKARFIVMVMSCVSLVGSVKFSADLLWNTTVFSWTAFCQLSFYLVVAALASCCLIVLSSSKMRDEVRTGDPYRAARLALRKRQRLLRRVFRNDLFVGTFGCWVFVEAELWVTAGDIFERSVIYFILVFCLFLSICDFIYGNGSRISKEGLRRDIY